MAKPRGESVPPAAETAPPPAPATAPETNWDLDFSLASTQPNGGYGIEIHEESDPFAEIAEHAAILYANGQSDGARTTLESAIHENGDPAALRLWAMLFDLLRIKGDRPAFDTLGLEFARLCELSPPSWNLEPVQRKSRKVASTIPGAVPLQGVLAGDDPVFESLQEAQGSGQGRILDLGRLASLDVEASAKLARLLNQARKRKLNWELAGAEGLASRLANRTVAGQAQDEPLWLLLLELYQYQGWEAQFEEKAVDYAITFEVSPPSWEAPPKPASPQPQTQSLSQSPEEDEPALEPEATALEGDILQGDLKEVARHLLPGEECRLDFTRVTRLDFVSAGALANLLKTAGASSVVIYHPNRLVAELMRVMGVDQLARVELSKH